MGVPPLIGDERVGTGSMGAVGRAGAIPEGGIQVTSHQSPVTKITLLQIPDE